MPAATQPAKLLGIPLGDFGFFSSLLLSLASGFVTFFASLFLAIISLLVWNTLGHHQVDYSDSYRYVAFPLGVIVLVCALVFFTGTWLRRRLSGAA
jgi:succinate dehydrogenase hydrophobic anchor subunit